MGAISLEIPSDIANQLRLPRGRAKRLLMEELVCRLISQEILSVAQGARLLGMERLEFEHFLAGNEIPLSDDAEGLAGEVTRLDAPQ